MFLTVPDAVYINAAVKKSQAAGGTIHDLFTGDSKTVHASRLTAGKNRGIVNSDVF